MVATKPDSKLIVLTSLPEFFQGQVERAMRQHELELKTITTEYLANLLHDFARADDLFQKDTPSLGEQLLESNQEMPLNQRIQLLKRIGDVALYVSGFFSDSLKRKLVDIDYYASIGGNAYSNLTGLVRSSMIAGVYGELAANFYGLVDLLSTISEDKQMTSNEDLLRLYERWMTTGSERLQKKLAAHGIIASDDDSDHNIQ